MTDSDTPDISLIVPNRNGGGTIERCLESAFLSENVSFEVVVVDDCSEDGSVERIRRFPCRLVELERHSGASAARNAGARHSRGAILFFTDADCLLQKNTLQAALKRLEAEGLDAVVGGTYTRIPPIRTFYDVFQSVFINYFETKQPEMPDYVAAHGMAIHAATFKRTGGFPEKFLPIIEDVEFSHRIRKSGSRLMIDPEVLVGHIFNFSLEDSLKNAFKKSRFWTMYSLENKDLLADSGTASRELKVNVLACFLCLGGALFHLMIGDSFSVRAVTAIFLYNLLVNAGLILSFFDTGGPRFGLLAAFYYFTLYPIAIGFGGLVGLASRSHSWRSSDIAQ